MEAKSYLDLLPEEIWQRINRIVRAHPTFAMIMGLPYEVRMYIVVQMPYPDVIRFCATSKAAKIICDDDYFWKLKVQHDFPNEMKYIVEELHQGKWRKLYEKYWEESSEKFVRCATDGHIDCVISWLQLGIDPDFQKGEWTALISASFQDRVDVVRVLLEYGANPNIQGKNRFDSTALIWASYNGNTNMVWLLLDHGAKPDFQNRFGYTALMEASRDGHPDVVRLLLEHGADPDLQDEEGRTALDGASLAGHTDIVRLLSE